MDGYFLWLLKGVKVEDRAVEEIKRHFDVVAESLKDDIKLIAEGHVLLNKTIGNLREDVDEFRKENAEEHALINKRIDEFRKENTEDHAVLNKRIDEFRKENAEEHAILNKRIDEFGKDIEKRVSRLESPH